MTINLRNGFRSAALPATALLAFTALAGGMAARQRARTDRRASPRPPYSSPSIRMLPRAPRRPASSKVLAFAQDNEREFMQGVDHGLGDGRQGPRARNIAGRSANNERGQDGRAGASFSSPPRSAPSSRRRSIRRRSSHSLQEVMWAGGYVGTIVPPPATSLLNAPQYETGKALGRRGGRLHQRQAGRQGQRRAPDPGPDGVPGAALSAAMRDTLKAMPGVTIVADITPNPVNKEGGFETMSTILQAHPDIDVVLGADTVVLGALAALEAAGKARPDQFLGGIDGEPGGGGGDQESGQPLQGEHRALLAGLRLRHGPARRRLAGGQEHPAGDGHPAHRADRGEPRAIREGPRRSRRAVYADAARRDTATSRCTATSATTRATST